MYRGYLLEPPQRDNSNLHPWSMFWAKIRKLSYFLKWKLPFLQPWTIAIWASTWENRSSGFPTRSDINRASQLVNIARCLKFWIKKVEELYYLCSENKGPDQLCGYRTTDLRLCFCICKKPVFSRRSSYIAWTLLCNALPMQHQTMSQDFGLQLRTKHKHSCIPDEKYK